MFSLASHTKLREQHLRLHPAGLQKPQGQSLSILLATPDQSSLTSIRCHGESTHGLRNAKGRKRTPSLGPCFCQQGWEVLLLFAARAPWGLTLSSCPWAGPFLHSKNPEDVFLLRVFCTPQVPEPCAVFAVTEAPRAWQIGGILSKPVTAQALVPPATIPSASTHTGRATGDSAAALIPRELPVTRV